jgi:hypothetical protein
MFYSARKLSFVVATSILALPACSQEHDLVINNGRLMDPETQLDQDANAGVPDGRIAVITQEQISGS